MPVRARRGDPAARGGAGDRAGAAGRAGPRAAELDRPGGDGGAAQRALRLRAPRAAGGAERSISAGGHRSAGATPRWTRWSGSGRRGSSTADTAAAHGTATRALALVESGLRAARAGALRRSPGRRRASAGPPRPCAHFAARRRRYGGAHDAERRHPLDVHGRAWAAHAHWLLGQRTAAQASAPPTPSRWPASLDHPYSLAVALPTARSRASCAATCRAAPHRRRAARAVRALRVRLLPRVGAGPRRLGPRRTGRARPRPAGASTTLVADGALARMPYWLSLLRRPAPARGDRTPPARRWTPRWPTPGPVTTCGGCPRCCGCGRRYDDGDAAVARLHDAARLAAEHGNVSLLAALRRDLAARRTGRRSAFPRARRHADRANAARTPRS